MKCNTCKNTVSDHMVYCPFCGNNLQTGAKSQDSRAVERELIDKWEKEENYSSVLQSALKGNSYAKYIIFHMLRHGLKGRTLLLNIKKHTRRF